MRAINTMTRSVLISSCVLLLALMFACGGPASQSGQNTPGASSTELPELTDELIHERINDAWLREVPEENGASEPISWRFDRDEPKEIVIVEKQTDGAKATVLLDVKTTSAPRSSNKRYLAGQIRIHWELRTGWVLRRWEIVDTENISMKYKNLPKPAASKDPAANE